MLHTQRTHLRNLKPSDAGALFVYRNDPQCSRYQRYDDTSLPGLEQFVSQFANSAFPSFQPEQHYAIVHSGNGQLLGDLSVFFSPDDRCFTLGITLSPGFQRQGYAFEVLGSVVEKLEQFDPTADIVALIEKGNDPSLALFQKLDFVEECYAQSIASYVYVRYAKEK